MTLLKDMADYAASLTGGVLTDRFCCAWMYAENGEMWPEQTNNPFNISYPEYDGTLPTGGVFTNVEAVLENKVCVYRTPEDGVRAWIEELRMPTDAHGGHKWLTLDLEDLRECNGDVAELASKIGMSNWAGGHYYYDARPGGLIVAAYENTVVSAWYAGENVAQVEDHGDPIPEMRSPSTPTHHIEHWIRVGETLGGIAERYRVPVDVLARVNNLKNENVIEAGALLMIPKSFTVRAGDTLSGLSLAFGDDVDEVARWNDITDPNVIRIGQVIYL